MLKQPPEVEEVQILQIKEEGTKFPDPIVDILKRSNKKITNQRTYRVAKSNNIEKSGRAFRGGR